MRWLIVLVGAMGALIVAGLALLGHGIYQKMATPDKAIPETKPSPPFAAKDITLPPGCRVLQIIPGEGRLFLHTGPGGGPGPCESESIITVNAADGTMLGTLNIRQALPSPQ